MKPTKPRKTDFVNVRTRPETIVAMKAAARRACLSPSAYARVLIERGLADDGFSPDAFAPDAAA